MKSIQKQEAAPKNYVGVNPIIRKLTRVEEVASENDNVASYYGITIKTLFFLLLTGVGFAVYFFAAPSLATGEPITSDGITVYLPQIGVVAIAGLFTILTPLLAWIIRPTIPVTGSIYCICQGILIGFISYTFAGEYNDLIILALIITLVLVFSMLVLYTSGIIKATKKFRTVLTTLMITSLITTVVLSIAYFIPGARPFVDFIFQNSVFSIVMSVIFIIIATLFLICDFNCIQETVEKRLPKEYEWIASFGLAFTIIWLYLKVLDLLMKSK